MTEDSWIAPALAANPSAPDDLLLALAATGDEETQLAMIRPRRFLRFRLSPVLAAALARSAHVRVRSELTACAHLPDDVLVRLAGDPERRVRVGVVARREEVPYPLERYAPVEAYALLVGDDDWIIQDELLRNPEVPDPLKREVERTTLRHPDGRLYDEVLLRIGPDAEAAAHHLRLLTDPDPRRRRTALASRRFVPTDLLPGLLADPGTRLAAVSDAPLTGDLARSLASDADPAVRAALALNPSLPPDLVRLLATDPDASVRSSLMDRPNLPLDVLDSIEMPMDAGACTNRVAWLWNARDDAGLVARYARSRQVRYRRTVARMPGLAPDVVALLAADEDAAVRLILTESNRDLVPTPVLLEVVRRWSGYTAQPMLADPRVPDEVIDELVRHEDSGFRWRVFHTGRLNEEQLARLADDPDPGLAAAANPPPPPGPEEFRARLADPSDTVRAAAAGHPALPVELMWELWRRAARPTG